jgi:histidinol-phosphate/aromatic aminotransferase/cobyric acid decarboxylase-like protein
MIPHPRVRNLAATSAPEFPEPDLVPDASVRRLNLNESPLPPSPRVIEAVTQAVRLSQVYPDHTCAALAARLSGHSGIPVERITFGNGSGELLTTTAWAAVGPGDEAVMPAPTFCPRRPFPPAARGYAWPAAKSLACRCAPMG